MSPGDNEIDERYRKAAGTKIVRIGLEDIGEVIKEGEISVAVSKDLTPSEKDTNVNDTVSVLSENDNVGE